MSATQSWFGWAATKFRSTRSGAGLGSSSRRWVVNPRRPAHGARPQLLGVTPEPGQFLTLSRSKPVALLLPAALLPVGLRHPVADRLCGRFELPGKLGRIAAGADQVDHLTAKLRCVWRTCLGHLGSLLSKPEGLHQTGSTSD